MDVTDPDGFVVIISMLNVRDDASQKQDIRRALRLTAELAEIS